MQNKKTCNLIGILREIADEEGNIVWSGDYSGWSKLTQESRLKLDIHHPFRLQNQHHDEETGLHYNFFRYYDPEIGWFTQQDPIRLMGGINFYAFAPNVQRWVDLLGLYTLSDAEESLSNRRIRKDNKGWIYDTYSDTQIFDEWIRMEQRNMGWINNIPKCPRTIGKCTEANGWSGGKSALVKWYHPGATYEFRSRPNSAGNTNQCTYDNNGNIIRNLPAAGSADYAHSEWGNKINHYNHDVKPYELAEKLGRIRDYYKVRPILIE